MTQTEVNAGEVLNTVNGTGTTSTGSLAPTSADNTTDIDPL